MRNTLKFVLCIFVPWSVFAQNLVPNNSFERIKSYSCSFSTPINKIDNYIDDWFVPTLGTTDQWFYDSLSSNICRQNLYNFKIRPKDGNICAGLYTFTNYSKNYREYIEIKLKSPLVKGKSYKGKFFSRLMERLSNTTSNGLGMLFSKNKLHSEDSDGIINLPKDGMYILQKGQIGAEWIETADCFTANDTLNYLIIGNFYSDEETTTKPLKGSTIGESYYLIDAISVETLDYVLPRIDLGKDTTLCYGQSIKFNIDSTNGKFVWSDGIESTNRSLSLAGKYWITAYSEGCFQSDSINVDVVPQLKISSNKNACDGENLMITINDYPHPILWNNGSSESSIRVKFQGVYWVKSEYAGCKQADTLTIDVIPCLGEIPNVFTPNGDGINEVFFIKNVSIEKWMLEIFNRYGQKVYYADSYNNDWSGDNLPVGIYYYNLTNSRSYVRYKGYVQILK